MARKGEDLLKDLDSLGVEDQPQASGPTTATATKKSTATSKANTKPASTAKSNDDNDENLFGDIEKQLASKPPTSSSRPATPRISSSSTSAATSQPAKHTPASSNPSARTSEDKLREDMQRRSTSRSREAGTKVEVPLGGRGGGAEGTAGGGWWGMFSGAANAARKQAESLAKTVQGNEEAQKWAAQVQGRLGGLQHLGDDLRARALPSFQALISHIAPPISAHERLQIHITHDIVNYPSLDPLIYSTFSRVMAQVEGGDLLVIQRGSESRSRTASEPPGYRGAVLGGGGSGWTDGPWWREEGVRRDLGAVPGLKEGSRLARVSAESYSREYFERSGGVEEAAKRATETLSETNPVRSSDIFLAIQAIHHAGEKELFAADAREGAEQAKNENDAAVVAPEEGDEDLVTFAIYLHDPIHGLSFSALSQALPQKWATWLDAQASDEKGETTGLPESIQEIIASGGVDPREWVAEWMEETLGLTVGVVAQRYVARRMGVGEGGLGRGKRRAEEEDIAGEAARAI